jgi:hypothetical protein
MKPSLRNSILTMLVIFSFGVALSATRLKLPAFSRSVVNVQEQPAVPAGAEETKNADEIELPALRAAVDAKIQADKADYLPGEVVVFSGSGWEPGESVAITIHEEPALHADRKLNVIADELGRIFDNQFVPETHEVGVIFIVKARGLSSGGAASTMAAQAKPAANIDQCANGGVGGTPVQCAGAAWQNGNLGQSQAHYNEGESVPYRASFTSLAAGQTYTATIEWDTTQSGKHALDYLTAFNRTETTASPCAGVSGVPVGACSSPTTFPIPTDPNVTAVNGFAGTQVPGNFTIYNGSISAVSAYTLTGTYAGSSSTRITLTFAPASAGTAVLAWGGHIATRVDWGQGFSAVAISGSPFHMRLVGFTCSNVANCGVGQQDRSLSSEAVVFPATITIIKDVANSNTDPTDFSFTTSGTQIAGFSLDDDAEATLSNTKTFGTITDFASTRTVTETDPSPTYALTALNCSLVSQQSQPGTATANLATRTATFVLKEAEAATCTFVNTLQNGTLRVIKSVTNDNGGNAAASAFTVHVKSGATDVAGSPQAGSTTGTVYSLATGSYTVSENDPASLGYAQGAFSGDCNSSTGVVTVVAGVEKTCTVTNNDVAPKLALIKSVTNDNGGNAGVNDFGLTIGGNATTSGTKVTLNANQAYAINEAGLTGYTFVSITGNAKCPAVLGGTVTLDEGDDISCTITNNDVAPKLTLIKSVTNNNGGQAGPNDFGLSIGGNATTSGTKVTLNANQAYAINEAGLSGYTFVSITGNAKCPAVLGGTVTLDEGDDISCTITNDDLQRATTIQTIMSWTLKDAVDLGQELVRGDCGTPATITFRLYRHDLGTAKAELTCDAGSFLWESAPLAEVDGAASTSHDVEEDGIYLWVAVYSGDDCNSAVTSDCGREVTEITDEDLTPASASPICNPAS